MASIGVLPTQTNVRITSDTGAHGTLEPASGKQAGCMTAAQAKALDELVAWRRTAEIAAPAAAPVVIQMPAPSQQNEPAANSNEPPAPVVIDREPEILLLRNELAHQCADIDALAQRIAAVEQRQPIQPEPSPVVEVDDDREPLPRMFRTDGETPPPVPAPPVDTTRHELANLQSEVAALSDVIRRMTEPRPEQRDPRADAIARVRHAAEQRRRAAMPGGSPILAIKLAEVAHWSRSGKEAAIASMGILAEAQGNGAWQETAADIVTADDSLMRVCVRTWAVEMVVISEIEQAEGDIIEAIATGATAALAAIQG